MKINNSQKNKKALKLFILFLCILTFCSPIFLLWHIEISMEFIDDIILTNGWAVMTPIKVYHFWVYVTLFTNWFICLFVIFNLDKILGIVPENKKV